jgi:hypothetical protein
MLKVTIAVLAIALAGTASAGWRSMRLEANDMASFTSSVAAFEKELSTARQYVFMLALQDIWAEGLQSAGDQPREFTETEYLRRLHGLTYDEVVMLADPTGEKTKERYRRGVEAMLADRGPPGMVARSASNSNNATPVGGPGGQYRGGRGY